MVQERASAGIAAIAPKEIMQASLANDVLVMDVSFKFLRLRKILIDTSIVLCKV